jgi:YfiH family protein
MSDFLRFSMFSRFPEFSHAISKRNYKNNELFNLADHVGENSHQASHHRKILCQELNLDIERLTVPQQVHETNIEIIADDKIGFGNLTWSDGIPATDALITSQLETPIMVLSADCPLILMYDPVCRVIAVIHSSWRCTFNGIIGKTIKKLADEFGTKSFDVCAGVGPGAGACCYEVDGPFIKTISARPELLRYVRNEKPKPHFDLFSAIRNDLEMSGVRPENIEITGICTICSHEYFSFRHEGKSAGRFGLVASLRKKGMHNS